MALTPEQQRLREGKLTASAVGALVSGDPEKIMDLWRFMVGDPNREEPDWQHIWPVRLGEASETVNLEFYEYRTGRALARRGEVVMHPKHNWACATLDAFDDGLVGPVDAKHVGGFETRETIVARYAAQMHWQMDVTGAKRSALSIIEGAREPVIEPVEWDADYSAELWRRAQAFMEAVWSLAPPITMPAIEAPVEAIRKYDFTGRNEWAASAATWLETADAAKKFEKATKTIKTMVPADAAVCFGHGVIVTRNRANALFVRES